MLVGSTKADDKLNSTRERCFLVQSHSHLSLIDGAVRAQHWQERSIHRQLCELIPETGLGAQVSEITSAISALVLQICHQQKH